MEYDLNQTPRVWIPTRPRTYRDNEPCNATAMIYCQDYIIPKRCLNQRWEGTTLCGYHLKVKNTLAIGDTETQQDDGGWGMTRMSRLTVNFAHNYVTHFTCQSRTIRKLYHLRCDQIVNSPLHRSLRRLDQTDKLIVFTDYIEREILSALACISIPTGINIIIGDYCGVFENMTIAMTFIYTKIFDAWRSKTVAERLEILENVFIPYLRMHRRFYVHHKNFTDKCVTKIQDLISETQDDHTQTSDMLESILPMVESRSA